MKRLSVILAVSVSLLLLTGCQSSINEKVTQPGQKKSDVVKNELAMVKVCRDFVKAQKKYSYMTRIDDSAAPYEVMASDKKGKDAVTTEPKDDKPQTAIGAMLTAAAADQTDKSMAAPCDGYLLKVIVAKGEVAPGGKNDHSTGGTMTKGFVLLAYPVKYGESGLLTFIVSHLGIIYEKDLGEKTAEIALNTNEYNVDDTWTPVSEN